jgi:CheY-like chemotaxis protein
MLVAQQPSGFAGAALGLYKMDDAVRIVVVDDVVDVADALSMQLSLDGYSVATAYDADDAIRRIEGHQPQCVLLDIGMPGIDGYELATLLRHRFKDDIVLIAVTGSDEREARVSDAFAVVDHYFQKPLDLNALRKILPSLLGAGRPRSRPAP